MKKKNLGEQIADELKYRIAVGHYSHALPGEVPLAAEMGVSRTALRDGLARLHRAGIIRKEKGTPSLINAEHIEPQATGPRGVVLLINDTKATLQSSSQLVLLQKELLARGIHVECIVGKRFSSRRLHAIAAARPERVYALLGSTAELQAEIATLGLPTLVIGTAHNNTLPCVDADYRPIAPHAVGLLRSHGYQRILMVMPESMLPGDGITLSAMQAATADFSMPMGIIVAKQPSRFTDRLANAATRSPLRTAVLVCRPADTLGTLVALLSKGVNIPAAVGLLSRDYLPLFDTITPAISCYDCKLNTTIRRAADALLKMTRNQPVHAGQLLVIPEYRPGGTIQ